VKDCRTFKPSFPYVPFIPGEIVNCSEDALYLNVFVPERKDSKPLNNLPVFFFIHGGGFFLDGASKFGDEGICKYLCSKDVIIVTINYRLGILGFLTLEHEDFKGNYGLWDMAMALKWTKENISAFGGDPNNITVGGQSAGGMATDILASSPHTWRNFRLKILKLFLDLFDKIITLGGTANSEWLNLDGTLSRKVMIEYAKYLGAEVNGKSASEINQQVGEFYKQVDVMKLGTGVLPNPKFKFYPGEIFSHFIDSFI
jgi:acetyl esterase/lipase